MLCILISISYLFLFVNKSGHFCGRFILICLLSVSLFHSEKFECVYDAQHRNTRIRKYRQPDIRKADQTQYDYQEFDAQCQHYILLRDAGGFAGNFHDLRDIPNIGIHEDDIR